jgi:stearoyl-CoA desaturase (delta-9 desaturase)
MYAGGASALWLGVSQVDILAFLFFLYLRGFGSSAGNHRYFSHRSFKTSRWFQYVLYVLAASAITGGPLSWATRHRYHHTYSDTDKDVMHSPRFGGFIWSQWISLFYSETEEVGKTVKDFNRYPEILISEKFWIWFALPFAIAPFLIGEWLGAAHGTSGWQMLAWGFFLPTVGIYNANGLINSWAHLRGSKRYDTRDNSRNSWVVNTFQLFVGEGWHNNHHAQPNSARVGHAWYEIDLVYYALVVLSRLGIVWDLQQPRVGAPGAPVEATKPALAAP